MKSESTKAESTRDPLMLAYWEQVLNGLVYELYFPEELHAAGLRLFDMVEQSVKGAASPLASVGGAARPSSSDQQGQAAPTTFLPTLRTKFEKLYDARHQTTHPRHLPRPPPPRPASGHSFMKAYPIPSHRLHEIVKAPKCLQEGQSTEFRHHGNKGKKLDARLALTDGHYEDMRLFVHASDPNIVTRFESGLCVAGPPSERHRLFPDSGDAQIEGIHSQRLAREHH